MLLVLDATTGQNGMAQAKVFAEAIGLTGVVLSKLDGSAKGGIVISVQKELGVPVKLVGLGEGPDDLAPFDPEGFVDGHSRVRLFANVGHEPCKPAVHNVDSGFCIPEPLPAPESGRKPDPRHRALHERNVP